MRMIPIRIFLRISVEKGATYKVGWEDIEAELLEK